MPQTGHFRDGPRVRAIDHFFAVPAGMTAVKVPPPERPGAAGHDVLRISVTTNVREDLEGALTLRAFREWAAKASRGEE